MGTVSGGLSIPYDLSQFGVSTTNKQTPAVKYRSLLRDPSTLAAYYDIPPHWLSGTQFDWAQALSPFQCASSLPRPPVLPAISPVHGEPIAAPLSVPVPVEDGADNSGDPWNPIPVNPLPSDADSGISIHALPPTPPPKEEEDDFGWGLAHPPSPPPPSRWWPTTR